MIKKLIIVDNFFSNPHDVRNFAIKQEYEKPNTYYPGNRTLCRYNSNEIKKKFEGILNESIVNWDAGSSPDNGRFQYATQDDKTWIHVDSDEPDENDFYENWAGVIYLTPNAPFTSGTALFEPKFKNANGYDISQWNKVDEIGNIFNRLILFNSNSYHASTNYFGDNINNGRLFIVYFFCINKKTNLNI